MINGIVAVPVMAMTMLLAANQVAMGKFTLPPMPKSVGWIATVLMAAAVAGMFATIGQGA